MKYLLSIDFKIPQRLKAINPRCIIAVSFLITTISGCASFRGIDNNAQLRDPASFATQKTFATTASDSFNEQSSKEKQRSQEEQWPTEKWWLQFNDAQLNGLIEEAFAHSPSLEAAAARIKLAQAYVGSTRAALYPQISASGEVTYQRFSENGMVPPPLGGSTEYNALLRLSGSYELDFWGKNRAALRSAVSLQHSLEAEQQSTTLLLTSNVAKTYVELDRLFAERDVVAQSLQQREKIFALTQQRVDAGLDTRAELKQAESQLPALRGQLAQLDEAIGSTRNALAALIGAGPDRGLAIQRPQLALIPVEVKLPADLPVNLLGRRPDIVAARLQAEAAQQQIDVAKAQFYPNVSLTAFAGYSSIGLDNLLKSGSEEYGIGPAIQLPIFNGGRLRENLKSKHAGYEAAVANYNNTLTTALRDVADQINALKWLQTRQQEQQNAAQIARTAFDLATQRYEAGLGNFLTVLNAESMVLSQDQLGVELSARALDLKINLIKALGGGYDTARQTANADH